MRHLIAIAAALAFTAPAIAQQAMPSAASRTALDAALANANRAADRSRDAYRHPAETLAFFQVRPDMTVVEYGPGGGWYTRILAPMLARGGGRYLAVNADPTSLNLTPERLAAYREGTASLPGTIAGWTGLPAAGITAHTTDRLPAELDGTVDRVLMIRSLHNLHRSNRLDSELKAMRRLLKAGGLLGIVQHRATPMASADYTDGSKGYLRQADVVNLVTAMGFELAGTSEVNANPADTADWPGGVWTLPPTYALKDQDRARYTAVGESDRMTLLFRKRD